MNIQPPQTVSHWSFWSTHRTFWENLRFSGTQEAGINNNNCRRAPHRSARGSYHIHVLAVYKFSIGWCTRTPCIIKATPPQTRISSNATQRHTLSFHPLLWAALWILRAYCPQRNDTRWKRPCESVCSQPSSRAHAYSQKDSCLLLSFTKCSHGVESNRIEFVLADRSSFDVANALHLIGQIIKIR